MVTINELKNSNIEDIIYKSIKFYLKIGEIEQAKKLLYLELQDERMASAALDKLVTISIKNGNYSEARELLKRYDADKSHFLSYGLLEKVEVNYERSKMYYEECLGTKIEDKAKLNIARLEIELGNFKKAENIYNELQDSKKFLDQMPYEWIFLEILKKNFEEAYSRLQSIDHELCCNSKKRARLATQLEIYLRHKLGLLNISEIDLSSLNNYFLYRYLTNEDMVLLKHVSYHKEKQNEAIGYIFENINLADLLEEVKERMKSLNPSHYEMVDKYKLRLDEPIGQKNNLFTNDICVETILGTDIIITMYPILLSDEFDQEKNNTSEELKRKRISNELQ